MDTRNVLDKYKDWPHEKIVADLDTHGIELEIAVENTLRDFNMGTIVRSANAFGVRHIHIVGRRQWNKRGAMMTDKYLYVHYHHDISSFATTMRQNNKQLVAIDNVPGSTMLGVTRLPTSCVMIFGQEGPGISKELFSYADMTVAIEQRGSTRSINVGVAAGILMYEWTRQHCLTN